MLASHDILYFCNGLKSSFDQTPCKQFLLLLQGINSNKPV